MITNGKTGVMPLEDTVVGSPLGSYAVRAYNNESTKYYDVVYTFVVSCGYDEKTADRYTLQIHNNGSAVCYWGSKERCEMVIADFAKIQVKAELLEEKS